jgi:antitoxin (DNA-binding transcriptional repressor) of toxin-antitoxin stability system
VRHAATDPITVTDRGQTIAVIQPASEPPRVTFAQRRLRPGFKAFMEKGIIEGMDSTQIISDDRDAR